MNLPERFSDLECFVEAWDHPDTDQRYAARLNSTMAEMTSFFECVLARAEEIKGYLDGKPMAQFTEQDRCLGRLMFAFAIVAGAVEIYLQPRVPDSGATEFEMLVEPELN